LKFSWVHIVLGHPVPSSPIMQQLTAQKWKQWETQIRKTCSFCWCKSSNNNSQNELFTDERTLNIFEKGLKSLKVRKKTIYLLNLFFTNHHYPLGVAEDITCQMRIPAIFSTVTNLGCIRKRMFNGTGFPKTIKNTFLTMHSFFSCSFLYNLMKLPHWLVWKVCKHCINVRLWAFYSPMLLYALAN